MITNMRRSLPLLVIVLALVPVGHAATTIAPAQSQALLRIAGKLSGLPVRRSVPIVTETSARYRQRRIAAFNAFYPPAAQLYDDALYAGLGLTSGRGVLARTIGASQARPALYDSRTRKVYLARGKESRQVILRELVQALQDQSFDLRRVSRLGGNRDASFGAYAASLGHASLVASLLTPKSLASHGGSRLARFLALQAGFPSTVGQRFAVTLRNLGGNHAVFSSLRRFPETTEQIFHVDKFLERERALPIALPVEAAGVTLVGDGTFGELDVRALLATFDVPRLGNAGSGWGGGRSAIYRAGAREAVVLALDWDEELDAEEWEEAVRAYVNEAFDAGSPGLPATTPCAASACWDLAGHTVAFERSGIRTALVLGPDVPTGARLARTILGLE